METSSGLFACILSEGVELGTTLLTHPPSTLSGWDSVSMEEACMACIVQLLARYAENRSAVSTGK